MHSPTNWLGAKLAALPQQTVDERRLPMIDVAMMATLRMSFAHAQALTLSRRCGPQVVCKFWPA